MLAAALNGVSIAEVRRTGIVREKTGVSLNDSQRKGLLRNGVLFKKKSALPPRYNDYRALGRFQDGSDGPIAEILAHQSLRRRCTAKAIAGVGGIAVEDSNAMTFVEQGSPPGLAYFDISIPGGAKYWVTPIRASVDSEGRIGLVSYRASATAKAPYNIGDCKKPSLTTISDVARGDQRVVPRLDRRKPRFRPSGEPQHTTEDIAKNLMQTLSSS